MKRLRLFILLVMLSGGAGCATCRQPAYAASSDSATRTDSKHPWRDWFVEQTLQNVIANLLGWVF